MASGSSSGNGNGNGFVVIDEFPKNTPKTLVELLELEENLKSNKTALLQLKTKKDEKQSEVDILNQQIRTKRLEVLKFKKEKPDYKKSPDIKKKGIEIVKKKKLLENELGTKEQQLLDIKITGLNLIAVIKKINNQLNLSGGGASSSKPKPVNSEIPILIEISELLLKQVDLLMKIHEIEDKLDGLGGQDELTDDMRKLIDDKNKLEKQKLSVDAIIEFMNEEIYTEEEKEESARDLQAKNEELEEELAKLLLLQNKEGEQGRGSQTGGKQDNKILSKQIGNTIKPQDEYYGKLYLEDNMLYYYDMNFHNVLTDKIPIVTILKLEKIIKEYKQNNKILSSNLKTNKSKKGKINKNKKTKKRK